MQAVLKISRTNLYKLINTDGFPSIRIGGRIFVSTDKLEEWINTYSYGKYETSPSDINREKTVIVPVNSGSKIRKIRKVRIDREF